MLVANYSTVRQRFKNYIEQVISTDQPLVVTQKDNSVVMISMERYNQLEKQARNAEYLGKLQHSHQQAVSGDIVFHDLVEVD